MGLKIVEETLDLVEPAFHTLYTEKEGKFVLTGIDGMKTDADISRLQSALVKERNDHKTVKEKYSVLGDKDPVEILSLLDKIPELETLANGKIDENKINDIVETRIKAKLSPLERMLEAEKVKSSNMESVVKRYEEKDKLATIQSTVRKAAVAANVRPEAIDDALVFAERLFELTPEGAVIAKENSGVTQGIDPTMWLSDLQSKKPHWWGETVGGGAGGSNGFRGVSNPWSADNWNMTEQGKLYNKNPSKAEQMARAAGTTIGGQKPKK